jgi:hypothetical protein
MSRGAVSITGFDAAVQIALTGQAQAAAKVLEVLGIGYVLEQRINTTVVGIKVLVVQKAHGGSVGIAGKRVAWQVAEIQVAFEILT